jgi:cytochrome d ubiquinol oxidase subunit I
MPIPWVTYWTFRLMIGFGLLAGLVSLLWLWASRRGRAPESRLLRTAAVWVLPLPFLANAMGWIFTEVGRQPWTVFGVLRTSDSDSPTIEAWQVATSLSTYVLLYTVLAVISVRLVVKYVRLGLPAVAPDEDTDDETQPRPLAFSY